MANSAHAGGVEAFLCAVIEAAAERAQAGTASAADIHHQCVYWLTAVQSGHISVPLLQEEGGAVSLPLAAAVYGREEHLPSLLAAGAAFVCNTLQADPSVVMPTMATAVRSLVHCPPVQEAVLDQLTSAASEGDG